jgi:hypothetical protein
LTVRPSGNIEERSDSHPLRIRSRSPGGYRQPSQVFEDGFCRQPICAVCENLDISNLVEEKVEQPHYAAFDSLKKSSKECPLCALFLNSLVESESFQADDSRSIIISASRSRITITFPSIEQGREDITTERTSDLQLFVDCCEYDHALRMKQNYLQNSKRIAIVLF